MLSSPKQSKKVEVNEAEVEHEEAEGTGNAVKDTIDTMFQQVTQTLHLEDEKHPQVLDAEHEDQTSLTSKTDTTRSVRSVKKLSSKQKLEMLKNLPSARKDEYKTYMAPPRHKKSSAKPLNVKENKKEESWLWWGRYINISVKSTALVTSLSFLLANTSTLGIRSLNFL